MAQKDNQYIKLSLLERVLLPSILKSENEYKTLKIYKSIREKCAVSAQEIKDYQIESKKDGSVSWNKKGADKLFDMNFNEFEKLEIKLALKELDEQKKLHIDLVSLYEKFVF